jgi:hypothetical protein
MATVAKDIRPPRKGARKRVLVRGTLFTPTGAHVVLVRDVSATGALVAGNYQLPNKCDVIFKRGDVFVAAQLAWSDETGAGIKFYRKLSEHEVIAATVPLPSSSL